MKASVFFLIALLIIVSAANADTRCYRLGKFVQGPTSTMICSYPKAPRRFCISSREISQVDDFISRGNYNAKIFAPNGTLLLNSTYHVIASEGAA